MLEGRPHIQMIYYLISIAGFWVLVGRHIWRQLRRYMRGRYYINLYWDRGHRSVQVPFVNNDLRHINQSVEEFLEANSDGTGNYIYAGQRWKGQLGLLLIVVSVIANLIPAFLAAFGFNAMQDFVYRQFFFHPMIMFVPQFFIVVGLLLVRWAAAESQKTADEIRIMDRRDPVLYLRPFRYENMNVISEHLGQWMRLGTISPYRTVRLEEALASRLQRLGPFVAIGEPGETLPDIGAARAYFDNAEWQTAVSGLIREARLICIMPGPGASVRWELEQVLRNEDVERSLIMLPPKQANLSSGMLAFIPILGAFAWRAHNAERPVTTEALREARKALFTKRRLMLLN